MRTVRTLALVLSVVILSSSLSAFGADRAQDGGTRVGDRSSITAMVKRIVKRILGIVSLEDIAGPKPAPTNEP